MLWIFLAAAGATVNAAYYIVTKRLLYTIDRNVLAAGGFFVTGVFLFILALIRGIPPLGNELFIAIAATSVLNIIATTLVFRALAITDISLAIPMLSFTPIFLILTSFVLLHEIPTLLGVTGICVIVTGSYVLNLSSPHTSFFDPFRAILKDRGSASMLIVAFLYAIALNFDKKVVLNSDPVFGSALVYLVIGISFFVIGQVSVQHDRTVQNRTSLPANQLPATPVQQPWLMEPYFAGVLAFATIGILLAIESVTINYAFMMQIVPYVIAIKRMSIILTVLYGTIVAREGEALLRLTGAGLMVAGAVLIILAG